MPESVVVLLVMVLGGCLLFSKIDESKTNENRQTAGQHNISWDEPDGPADIRYIHTVAIFL